MSGTAKTTLASTALGAIGIVVFVHFQQRAEKAVSLQAFLLKLFGEPDTLANPG